MNLVFSALCFLAFGPMAHAAPNPTVTAAAPAKEKPSFRPALSLVYMHIEGASPARTPMRSSWAGLNAQGDLIAWQSTGLEAGLHAQLLSSIFGLSQDAFDASMTEAGGRGYLTLKVPTQLMGTVHARFEAGYFGNWRFNSATSNFLDPFTGPQVRVKLSTSFDESIRLGRFGVVGSYGFAQQGVVQGGLSLTHRLSRDVDHPWDLLLAAMLGVARGGSRQENWSTIEVGLSGAI